MFKMPVNSCPHGSIGRAAAKIKNEQRKVFKIKIEGD
jgi:hypothetical protein